MRIGNPDDGNAAAGKTQRLAYDTLAEGFGRGFNGPIEVVVTVPSATDRAAVARVHDALQADPGVAAVTAPIFNPAGDTAVLTANPTTGPQDPKTDELIRHLRADVLPPTLADTNAKAMLTGQAMATDLADRLMRTSLNTTRSPMSAMARSASPSANGQLARSNAIGAPKKMTPTVSQNPSTAMASEKTPIPALMTLITPMTMRNIAQVRRVL